MDLVQVFCTQHLNDHGCPYEMPQLLYQNDANIHQDNCQKHIDIL